MADQTRMAKVSPCTWPAHRDEPKCEKAALVAEVERLRAQVDRYDAFFDDAFPDDPYLKGCLDGEWDAFERRGVKNGSKGTPSA